MIKSIKVTNNKNESIEMILNNPSTSELAVEKIEGLQPEKTNINSTENQTSDGSSFDSAVTGVKDIVFSLIFMPNDGNIERVRHKCYKYFPIKNNIIIQIETDERNIFIEGYVESNEVDMFSEQEGCTISVLCMTPFFKSSVQNTSIIKGSENAFVFPFSNNSLSEPLLIMGYIKDNTEELIYYNGEVTVPVKMRIDFCSNISSLTIMNLITPEQKIDIDFSVIGHQPSNGDYLIINTTIGQKSIKLYTDDNVYDVAPGINIRNTNWIYLLPGYNHIVLSHTNEIKKFEVYNNVLYGGV